MNKTSDTETGAMRRIAPPAELSAEQIANAVDWAISSRTSVRAFSARSVDRHLIDTILSLASRAPSGTNTQPWQVRVVTGATRARLVAAIHAAFDDEQLQREHREEYAYYPQEWISPYIDRRRKLGWDLYNLLGIGKGDRARTQAQHRRNFQFFDAPVGLIFTIDRVMQQGSWLDYGMFLQNIMVAARGHGLDTCPQAAFTQYHKIIAQELDMPSNEMLVCGMGLGYADTEKIENTLHTERDPVSRFTRYYD
jgi:nitroreductase